jgi:hypothetical protein
MAAEATLNNIIDDARTYASESYDLGADLIDSAQNAARAYTWIEFTGSIPNVDEISIADVTDPGDFAGSLTKPGGNPSLGAFGPVHIPVFDSLREAPDPIDTGDLFQHPVPDGSLPNLDAQEPVLNDPTLPDEPVLQDITFPTLRDIEVPDAPDISLPAFAGVRPQNPPTAPNDLKCMFDDAYNSMLPEMQAYIDTQVTSFIERYYPDYSANMAKAQTRLEEMLDGKALPEEIEQAIFDRARGRVNREVVQAEDNAFEAFARRGFTMPQGMLAEELSRGHQAAADRNAQAAIDIAVKQAEIAQSNLQFAITSVLSLQEGVRAAAIQYAQVLVGTNQAALQYAQALVSSAVELYNVQVKQFGTEVELYKAYASVYELEIKAELAKIEIFEAEVKLATLQGDLNKLDVELVGQQVDLSKQQIQLYAEQLRGAALVLDVQAQKLDLYKAQVEAYLAKVRVKESEFKIYEAAMSGDEMKVRANMAEFEAYRAEAAALTAGGQLEVAHMKGDIERNSNIIDIYKAEVAEYAANLDFEKVEFEADLKAYLAALDRYKLKIETEITQGRLLLEQQVANGELAVKEGRLSLDARIASSNNFVKLTGIQADTAIQGARIYASIAEAAVSAQHTMVQLVNQTVQ